MPSLDHTQPDPTPLEPVKVNPPGLLAVIPARGGSKGIPDKNLAFVADKPLLAWTIEAARSSACVDRIILSTDCPRIRRLGLTLGAEAPFIRPEHLATDEASGMDVLLDVLQRLEESRALPEWVCYLQPTSPLRLAADIDAAFALARTRDADTVLSVTAVSQHPSWMRRMDDDQKLTTPVWASHRADTRQGLPALQVLNGAIYLAKTRFILKNRSWLSENSFGFRMPPERSIDIDEPWQMRMAELLLLDRQRDPGNVQVNRPLVEPQEPPNLAAAG
ncbi:MAG: acylneuraminate cytidylyltransferase family protein [Phycisphaeraceae bacterium]|nr:acylneuraminate cytidylyltransferase family protein [Phycisphaeraceae bacterium]